ncbi:UNVERIFIED_CONTAM: hypothetical protein FKN15_002063 [Acipenser sinensis]
MPTSLLPLLFFRDKSVQQVVCGVEGPQRVKFLVVLYSSCSKSRNPSQYTQKGVSSPETWGRLMLDVFTQLIVSSPPMNRVSAVLEMLRPRQPRVTFSWSF